MSWHNFFRYGFSHPLASRARSRALLNIILWQVRSRLTTKSIRNEWIGGTFLMVRKGMTGATGNLYYGLHEFSDMGFLLHLLRPGDLFVDVGANVGSYTVLASGVCGARSISFEPDPKTMVDLLANIEANNLANHVTAMQMAVGAKAGELNFTVGLDTMNRIVDSGFDSSIKTQTVAVSMLDHELRRMSPIFMKIDVEGFEEKVIEGADQTLANPSLIAILLETVNENVLSILKKHGFSAYSYDPFSRQLREPNKNQYENNQLFVRESKVVAARVSQAPAFRALGVLI